MKYFKIPPTAAPTVVERALMLMVENHEAFPRTIALGVDHELFFYKLLTP